MKRFVAVFGLVGVLGLTFQATAEGVGKLIVQNDTNSKIWCAFTQYDGQGKKWITYSWWAVENGSTHPFNNVTYCRCETEDSPERYWGNQQH
ncbi:MAG: hypothetical protein ACXW3G_11500, partial [Rhodoplanes sp.]